MSLYPVPPTTGVPSLTFIINPTTIVLTPSMLGGNFIITTTSGAGSLVNLDTTALAGTPAGWYINMKVGIFNPTAECIFNENGNGFVAPFATSSDVIYGWRAAGVIGGNNAVSVYLYWDGTHLMIY